LENVNEILKQHPLTWRGIMFTNKHDNITERVLSVSKNGKRYTIFLDSENEYCKYVGYDYITFRKNWF